MPFACRFPCLHRLDPKTEAAPRRTIKARRRAGRDLGRPRVDDARTHPVADLDPAPSLRDRARGVHPRSLPNRARASAEAPWSSPAPRRATPSRDRSELMGPPFDPTPSASADPFLRREPGMATGTVFAMATTPIHSTLSTRPLWTRSQAEAAGGRCSLGFPERSRGHCSVLRGSARFGAPLRPVPFATDEAVRCRARAVLEAVGVTPYTARSIARAERPPAGSHWNPP